MNMRKRQNIKSFSMLQKRGSDPVKKHITSLFANNRGETERNGSQAPNASKLSSGVIDMKQIDAATLAKPTVVSSQHLYALSLKKKIESPGRNYSSYDPIPPGFMSSNANRLPLLKNKKH